MKSNSRQRNALIFKVTDSPFFEEAHLIFKEDTAAEQESEMVKEAVRIISSCRPPLQKKKESRKSALFYFICGIACALITLFAGGLFLLLLRSCGLF